MNNKNIEQVIRNIYKYKFNNKPIEPKFRIKQRDDKHTYFTNGAVLLQTDNDIDVDLTGTDYQNGNAYSLIHGKKYYENGIEIDVSTLKKTLKNKETKFIIETENGKLGFNPKLLSDGIKATKSNTLFIEKNNIPLCKFVSSCGKIEYMLLPIRIN